MHSWFAGGEHWEDDMPPNVRTVADIDRELRLVCERRHLARLKISALSSGIVNDTRLIDLLLAQRTDLIDRQILAG